MSIIEKLDAEIKQAMKDKNQARLETMRLIKATVKNKEIELIHPLSDAEFLAVLATMVKQRRESIDQFKQGGREDLVGKEEAEIAVIQTFLPAALSADEVTAIIKEAATKVNASGPKDMGLIMKEIKDKTAGRVDGRALSEQVKSFLSSI